MTEMDFKEKYGFTDDELVLFKSMVNAKFKRFGSDEVITTNGKIIEIIDIKPLT